MSFWNALRIGSSALAAQRLRLNTISNNIANAETTRTAEGGAYQRKDVVFTPEGQSPFLPTLIAANRQRALAPNMQMGGVKVAQVVEDAAPGPRVYDPSHPDADEEGYVTYPNVNLVVEMTNMLSASRSYEASLTVIETAKKMAMKALEIGR